MPVKKKPLKKVHRCQCAEGEGAEGDSNPGMHARMNLFLSRLNEPQRRGYAALESERIGRGGDRLLSRITGLDEKTLHKGRKELAASLEACPTDRLRLAGGGRKPLEKKLFTDKRPGTTNLAGDCGVAHVGKKVDPEQPAPPQSRLTKSRLFRESSDGASLAEAATLLP